MKYWVCIRIGEILNQWVLDGFGVCSFFQEVELGGLPTLMHTYMSSIWRCVNEFIHISTKNSQTSLSLRALSKWRSTGTSVPRRPLTAERTATAQPRLCSRPRYFASFGDALGLLLGIAVFEASSFGKLVLFAALGVLAGTLRQGVQAVVQEEGTGLRGTLQGMLATGTET